MLLFYCGCAWAADAVEMMLLSFLGPAVSLLVPCTPDLFFQSVPNTFIALISSLTTAQVPSLPSIPSAKCGHILACRSDGGLQCHPGARVVSWL